MGLAETYTMPLSALGGARITPLPYPDSYDGWPVAMDERAPGQIYRWRRQMFGNAEGFAAVADSGVIAPLIPG